MPRFPTPCRRLCCSRRVPCSHKERRLAYHKPPLFTDHSRPTALLVPRSVIFSSQPPTKLRPHAPKPCPSVKKPVS